MLSLSLGLKNSFLSQILSAVVFSFLPDGTAFTDLEPILN